MYVKCPLCGFTINTLDKSCQKECPLGQSCTLVCCPNCRYSFVKPESTIVNVVKKVFGR